MYNTQTFDGCDNDGDADAAAAAAAVTAGCCGCNNWRYLRSCTLHRSRSCWRSFCVSTDINANRYMSYASRYVHFMLYVLIQMYRVGQKNQTCLSVDNSAMVSGRKSCDMSKVSECCKELTTSLHSEAFKYSLPNLHKYLSPLIFCPI